MDNGGTITDAWSTKVWSGEAAVHVSIVNWIKKGDHSGVKTLFRQDGDDIDSPLSKLEIERISSALSGNVDITKAKTLHCNTNPKTTHQGQTHGHKGFLLTIKEAQEERQRDPRANEVLFRFLTIDELLEGSPPRIKRYAIDFHPRGLLEAQEYKRLFERLERLVLPAREAEARREEERNNEALEQDDGSRVNWHHKNFLRKWWLMSYPRAELMRALATKRRYIACGRVTKRPIFAFIPTNVHPNDALQVFTFDDDYSFGILQSPIHWEWFTERCSTLKGDWRYTSTSVYDSFPWPQNVSLKLARQVSHAGRELRELRSQLMTRHGRSLRELYRSFERPEYIRSRTPTKGWTKRCEQPME